ncbi:MAG: aldo/keto reductase [Pirellulales bacterium]|nr:aldo/keto reductase [Pirellulales bacterium]
MEYVKLGKSDLQVSHVAFGLALRGQSSVSAAERLIEHAADSGITMFDCANIYQLQSGTEYAHERSQEILGRVLGHKRDKVVITNKVGVAGGPGTGIGGCSRRAIMEQIDLSLKALNTDYVDLYFVHVFDPETPLEETWGALDEVVQSGKARYIGCSNYQAWQVCKTLWLTDKMETTSPVCVQNSYNLLNRGLEREMFSLAEDQQLGVMTFSPLSVGLLSGQYKPGEPPPAGSLWSARTEEYNNVMQGDAAAAIETMRKIARQRNKPMTQLAMNWVLANQQVSVVVAGADTREQLDDTLGALDWELSEEEMTQLNERFLDIMIW